MRTPVAPSLTRMSEKALPVTLVRRTVTLLALIAIVPETSKPSITVPAVETVIEPDARRVVPAGTPVVDADGNPPDGGGGAGAVGAVGAEAESQAVGAKAGAEVVAKAKAAGSRPPSPAPWRAGATAHGPPRAARGSRPSRDAAGRRCPRPTGCSRPSRDASGRRCPRPTGCSRPSRDAAGRRCPRPTGCGRPPPVAQPAPARRRASYGWFSPRQASTR